MNSRVREIWLQTDEAISPKIIYEHGKVTMVMGEWLRKFMDEKLLCKICQRTTQVK